jgi:molecular chaperone GrpE
VGDANARPATDAEGEHSTPDDLDPRVLRALADRDNVRKRYERRLATAAVDEQRRVLSMWLPVVDDLERALQYSDGDPSRVVAGVRSVYEHALAVLARLGLERFEDVGEQFDPERHEAVGAVDADAAAGTIVASTQAGYTSQGTTLRPARVIVARATNPPDSEKPHSKNPDSKKPNSEKPTG